MSIFKFTENLFESVGTKAKEAAAKVAEPYLPPEPPPEPYQWQEPLNLDAGLWTDPIPEQGWTPTVEEMPMGGGFDGMWVPPLPDMGMSEAPVGFGVEDIYAQAPQPPSPIDWGQWDSAPIPGEGVAGPTYGLNFDWNLPVTDYDTFTGEPIQQVGWQVNGAEMGDPAGFNPVKAGLGQVWDGYNLVNDAFAETGLDLTPAGIDLYSGQAISDAFGNLPGPDWLGDTAGAIGEQAWRFTNPISNAVGMGSDLAETMGWYKPGTGYDDAAGAGQNLVDAGWNPIEFAQQQQTDLYERPFGEQIFGQAVFDPTNVVGGGFLSKADNVPDWLRGLDAGVDALQSAPFRAFGAGKYLEDVAGPIGKALGDETGETTARIASRASIPAIGAGGGYAWGYANGDTEEERLQKAMLFGLGAGAVTNSDVIARGYGAGLRLLTPERVQDALRFGVDKIAARPHSWEDEILPIPEVDTQEKFGLIDKAVNARRGVKDMPVVRDAGRVMIALQGKALNTANEMVGSLMQTLDDAAIRIDENTGRALTRDGQFMPVFKTGQKGIDAGDLEVGAIDNIVTGTTIDEAADWSDVAEQWWKYLDAGYIDQQQVDALRKVDSELGRIVKQQEAMGIEQPAKRPLWNYAAPDGKTSLYFPRGVPETQNIPLDAPMGEEAERIRVFGREPGTSKEAKFETAGENIVTNNMRYPALDKRLSRYVVDELNEIIARGVLPQINDVPLPSGGTLGQLLINPKADLKELGTQMTPLKREIKRGMDKASIYFRSAKINEGTIDRLDEMVKRAESRFGDVNEQTVGAAQTFYAQELNDYLDDAMAVLDVSDDMYRTAVKEGDSLRAAQIRMAPELKAEERKLRAQVLDLKKKLAATDDSIAYDQRFVGRANEAFMETVGQSVPAYDTIMIDAVKDALTRSIAHRDMLAGKVAMNEKLLAANPLGAADGVADDMKRADALKDFGKKLSKSGKKKAINLSEEMGRINRALGVVETAQGEISRQSRMSQLDTRRALDWMEKVRKATEELEPLEAKRKNLVELEAAVKKIRQGVKAGGPTGQVNIAGLMNITLPQEISTTVNRAMKSYFKEERGIPIVGAITKLTRPFMTALDASFVGATGTGVLFDRPATWAKGGKQGFEAMMPKLGRTAEQIERDNIMRWNKMLADNDLPSVETLIGRYNLQVATSELSMGQATKDSFTEAVKDKRLLDAYGNLPGIKQSQQGFTVAGNLFRAETAVKSLIDARIRNGGPLGQDTINSIVTHANSIGARANRTLGSSAKGVQLLGNKKAGDLWFAGRFYQSQFDLLANAVLNGNMEGDLAREAMIRMALASGLTVKLMNDVAGEETEWNPISDGRVNPNWLRVRFMGQDISPLGSFDALGKAILATTIDPANGGEKVLDYFRGRLSPGAGLVLDTVIGAKRAGTTLEMDGNIPKVKNAGDVLDYINPLPLGVQQVGKDVIDTDWGDPDSVAKTLFGVALSGLSFKANPMTETERMYEAASKEYDGLRYKGADLSRAQTKFVKDAAQGNIENDPLAMAQWKKSNPDLVPEPKSEESKAYAAAKADRDAAYADINERFTAKGSRMTLADMKEERKLAQAEYQGAIKDIEFSDREKGTGTTPQDWVDGYFDIFDTATGADGEVDWDKFDKGYQRLLKEYGKTSREREAIDAYIEEYLRKELPESLYAEKKAYSELEELGAFDMPRYNLQVLDDESALEYLAQVREAQEIDWSERNTKPGVDKPPLASFAPKWLKEELDLTTKEIQDVMRVNAGEKYWTKEYRDLRDEHPELFIWFKPDTTWAVIQAKGGD